MIDHDCVVNVYNILDWKHLIKFFFASVFHTSNFPMLFSGLMALVPVQENSSVNPTIMFSKLFYWFGVLLYEKCWHMFVEVAGQTRLVSGRCLSITATVCTGVWFIVTRYSF